MYWLRISARGKFFRSCVEKTWMLVGACAILHVSVEYVFCVYCHIINFISGFTWKVLQ